MSDSIYTLKLTRRGHVLPESMQTSFYMLRTAADALSTPMLRLNLEDELQSLKNTLNGVGHQPHLLILQAERILGVISSEVLTRETLLGHDISKLGEHIQGNFVVVGKDEMLFDVVSKMRVANSDLAIVTGNGRMTQADDVVGILSRRDIVDISNLPPFLVIPTRSAADSGARPERDKPDGYVGGGFDS